MIGFYDEYYWLWQKYSDIVSGYNIKTLLDVGCGRGWFLKLMSKTNPLVRAKGVDLSDEMISIAQNSGVDAQLKDIRDIDEKFDAVTAIGDVLNYLDKNELKSFLKNIKRVLNKNGVFITDINTLYGFDEVANGSLVKDKGDEFLIVDSKFDGERLENIITLFTKQKECFKKEQETITQYYHTKKRIEKIINLKLIASEKFSLFGEKEDKELLIFQQL
jgi:cyclopropane fatty-acyl-phospholipid synthase-like methyltransferase